MDDGLGWRPDPTGRHQERYFTANGIPTNLVRNSGVVSPDVDRVKSATSGPGTLSSVPAPAGAALPPQQRPRRVLVSKYTAQTEGEAIQRPPAEWVPPAQPDRDPAGSGTRWWLIGAICVLLALLVGVSVVAFQEHHQATQWMNDYHTAASDYHAEAHKDATLFVSLLASRQNLSVLEGQKDLVCLRLEALNPNPDQALAAACAG